MGFQKIPAGTRGRTRPSNAVTRVLMRTILRVVDRYQWWRADRAPDTDLLRLTTVGAKTGQERQVVVTRVAEGDGWLVIASMGGARHHPSWYHNIAAHPDQVWVEVGDQKISVRVEQLDEGRRADAWTRITTIHPTYLDYADKTDRLIPILKLTPAAT